MTDTDTALRTAAERHLGTHRHINASDHDELYAALAAASPPPLDVERLARAVMQTANTYEGRRLDTKYEWWETPRDLAAAIARAYAAEEGS